MRCRQCETSGQTSSLGLLYTLPVPAIYVQAYFDELGKFHDHRPRLVSVWECSNGHRQKWTRGNCCEVDEFRTILVEDDQWKL